jgi:hypothetical protein
MKKKSNKATGSAFEDKVIASINSGALSFSKGDGQNAESLFEIKYTDKLGFRISQKILAKLWEESLCSNKIPKLVIGLPKNETELYILTCDLHIQKK